jgi:hypothetical protein
VSTAGLEKITLEKMKPLLEKYGFELSFYFDIFLGC